MLIHRRQRFGMCPKHSAQHYARLQAERNKAKARKQRALAAQLAAQHTALEEERMPEVKITKLEEPVTIDGAGRARREWTDEQKQEIGLLYEQGLTYEQIKDRTGAGNGVISTVVTELGLPRRGMGNRKAPDISEPRFQPKPENIGRPEQVRVSEPEIPEAQKVALENMLKLPPKPEPVAPTPNLERRTQQPAPGWGPRWVVRVEGEVTSNLDDIADVVAAIKKSYPHLRIMAINPA